MVTVLSYIWARGFYPAPAKADRIALLILNCSGQFSIIKRAASPWDGLWHVLYWRTVTACPFLKDDHHAQIGHDATPERPPAAMGSASPAQPARLSRRGA